MDEEVKKKVAQFRFGVIADLAGARNLSKGERQRILKEKSAVQWDIPYSGRTHISPSTIKRWIRLYESSGRRIESLYPDDREDRGKTRAIDEETALALINLKKELKGASLPVILREARQKKILHLGFKAGHATIYRLFKRHGVMEEDIVNIDRRRSAIHGEHRRYIITTLRII
jgi:putative transposase